MVAQSPLPEYSIGTRIECCGYFGTIKYIGTVEGHSGEWLGIDWDDMCRGKHNGTVNGVHYFDTKHPKSGSFLRKEKANFGQSIIKAIETRYGYKEDEVMAKMTEQQLLKFQQEIKAPFFQLVGFDKISSIQRDFDLLKIVNVRLQNVSYIGASNELMNLFPNIRELDVSKNLLSSWAEIFDICLQLKRLYWLNISENVLSLPKSYKEYVFPNIAVLICGYMNLTWDEVREISVVFPNIEELRVPYNNIGDLLTPNDHNFKQLKYLDLEGNNIQSWSKIRNLAVIKTLEHLTLENTNLENIDFEENVELVNEFSNLGKLNISVNAISEWRSIGELNKLKNFEHLRFQKNPVLETESFATREQIVIAKIKNLKSFNGRTIQEDERRGAEYDYVKKYALEWAKVQHTEQRDNFLLEHNRYLELIERYGTPEESELIVQPNILESTLVNVVIVFEQRRVLKKLPPTILIQKLVMLIQKMMKLPDRPTLQYVSGSQPDIRIDLDDEMKELGYYSIQDGDTIIVQT